ncbi:NAD(P)-dependent dehydrogenase (short-subunit alcohol dehydrogenase family) [Paraburkholderia sp. BL23I1N1]|uniref:SDR family NAD(P)-dependent oxidoreductase n=1 Tax=Paraburkholderia sp. BL23I1N1 TaxID=1938802 RepID=UPI000E716831|nr:SDR family oxidoreductase [Paraburkholderia sp. BL23I1N1]RKE38624.1 NAD(P)-dependent dehydrogenase (short-subunit alcohol dehydrogenase family) [Paraburkholderia sp. BL23I1N1]
MTNYTSNQSQAPFDFGRLAPSRGFRLVVVGSHGGIGRALCQAALSIEVEVIALDTASAIDKAGPMEGLHSIAVDVTDNDSIDAAFSAIQERWGSIDGLAFVSGIGARPTPATEHTVEQWDRTMDVNLRGAFLTMTRARPLLLEHSSVVIVSSGLAQQADPGFLAYSASKAGLVALAKTLAKEWAPIRVNTLSPGLVNTPFLAGGSGQATERVGSSLEDWFGVERARAIIETIPLRRIAEPEDIVAPMLFLLGPASRFVTGHTFHVNGGRLMA